MNHFYEGTLEELSNLERLSNLESLAKPWHSFTHYLLADLVKKDNKIYYCKREHISHDDSKYDFKCHDYWELITYISNFNKPIITKERKNNTTVIEEKPNIKKKLSRKVFLFNEK